MRNPSIIAAALLSALLLTSPAVNAKPAETAAQASAEPRALVRSPGKPSHPISVAVEMDAPLKAGEEATGRLTISSNLSLRSMNVVFAPESGLTVLSDGLSEKTLGPVAASKSVGMSLKVIPGSDEARDLRIVIRAVKENGAVITREAGIHLGDEPKKHDKLRRHNAAEAPANAKGVVVKAEQEIIRGQ